jgi:hypothetical protein
MFTTIITDCHEDNEAGRQISRLNSLGLGPANLIGVRSDFSEDATIEGGVNLIDILDATEGKKGIVVLNVAPRGNKLEGANGNPFSYFYYKETLVISTTKGHCLSFVGKLQIVNKVNLLDIKNVLSFARKNNLIDENLEYYTANTQFRSFDFVPRLARWLIDGFQIPFSTLSISKNQSSIKPCIWCVDAFGNVKTTILSNEFKLKPRQEVKTNIGSFKYYYRLKDVPFGESAIYTGSSGIGEQRFLELTVQGIPGSISKKMNLKIGDIIEIK